MLLLGSAACASPYWLTFNQVQQFGGRVKKGAKSELVIFWKFFDSQKEAGDAQSGNERTSKRRPPILRYYRVFNVEQTEGLEKHLPPPPEERTFTPIETAARIVEAIQRRPPVLDRHRPAPRDVAEGEVQQFQRRLVGRERATILDNLPQTHVDRLDSVRSVNDPADFFRVCEECDEPLPVASP